MDELLDLLAATRTDILINGIYYDAPMYADNFSLVADNLADL